MSEETRWLYRLLEPWHAGVTIVHSSQLCIIRLPGDYLATYINGRFHVVNHVDNPGDPDEPLTVLAPQYYLQQ